MSDINANIVVSPIDLGVVVNTNQLTFTPEAISLNLYAGGVGTSNSLTANIANVHIFGGTNGYVLQTDGTGNLSWTSQTGGGGNGSPGGADTQVQYNNGGLFGGTTGFTFISASGNLNVPGNVIAPNFIGTASYATTAGFTVSANIANVANSVAGANVTGQVSNSLISSTVYTNAQPNITSVGTLTSLSVTGNISSGNANLGNLTKSNYFQGDGSLLTNISVISNSISNGNSNISIPVAAGNINFSVNGNANVVIVDSVGRIYANYINATNTITGNNIVGNRFLNGTAGIFVPANGNLTFQANGTNSMTITNSNVTASRFISNVATGTSPFVVTSTTLVANLNVANSNVATTVTSLTTDSTVGSLTANSYIVGISNNSTSLGFTSQRFSNLFVGNIYFSGNLFGAPATAPAAATSTTPTNKLPIVINGNTYYICLTDTP